MRPAVATVLSSRPWEPELVRAARQTAMVRVVGRAYDADELLGMNPEMVVVGSETAWLSAPVIRTWKARGWRVLGVHAQSDQPGRRLLEEGGADLVVPESTLPDHLLQTLSAWSFEPSHTPSDGSVVTVTGARGAPGRTTVAVALALASSTDTVLLDADPLPNVGPALGLGPGPELDRILHDVRNDNGLVGLVNPEKGLAVLCPETKATHRPGALFTELVMTMRGEFGRIIMETGPPGPDLPRMLRAADSTVLVVDGTSQGIIRAASLVQEWPVDPPTVVLNRIRGDKDAVVRSCRSALGLDPEILLPRFATDPVVATMPFLAEVLCGESLE